LLSPTIAATLLTGTSCQHPKRCASTCHRHAIVRSSAGPQQLCVSDSQTVLPQHTRAECVTFRLPSGCCGSSEGLDRAGTAACDRHELKPNAPPAFASAQSGSPSDADGALPTLLPLRSASSHAVMCGDSLTSTLLACSQGLCCQGLVSAVVCCKSLQLGLHPACLVRPQLLCPLLI